MNYCGGEISEKPSLWVIEISPRFFFFFPRFCSSVPADGVVFAGLNDVLAALQFLAVAFLFTDGAEFQVAFPALA